MSIPLRFKYVARGVYVPSIDLAVSEHVDMREAVASLAKRPAAPVKGNGNIETSSIKDQSTTSKP